MGPPPLSVTARGRGAKSNASGRYESEKREAFDDGWTPEDEEPRKLETTLSPEKARVILTRNDSPDIGFDRSINPYRGCEHGCIYCYARPAPVHIGGNTDPYQPVERTLRITRGVLEVVDRFNHPLSIITKSALIARDADILGRMGQRRLARAFVSITTLDRKLARAMEPRAATPERRLDAIRALADAGCPVGVGFAPAIPGLNDHEMEAVLERAAEAGATSAMFVVLRLPLEIKDLFREWLEAERPDRARRVMSLVRQLRGGRDYDPQWGQRMIGKGPISDLISKRFDIACNRLGLNQGRRALRLDLFKPPEVPTAQLDLFV